MVHRYKATTSLCCRHLRLDFVWRNKGTIIGYISCDSVKINNNNKKSVIVNKQQKLTMNAV